MRCYFNVRSKADISQLNLPHGRDAIKHYQGVFWAGCLYKQAKQLQRHNFGRREIIFTGLPTRHNGLMGEKSKGAQFNDSIIILTKSVSVEAIGCEQLAQSRYAAAPWPGSNSRPLDRKSDALPLRHHTLVYHS